MAIRVVAEFIFTEDEFEALSFNKKGDIIENMLKHSDWDVEVSKVETTEWNIEEEASKRDMEILFPELDF